MLALTTLPSLVSAGAQTVSSGVTITFLANEGVLLSTGDKKVLVDALFLRYESGYALPADSTQTALARARPPFDGVHVVLVTHRHGDHFHPAPVAEHLRANPAAVLVTSRQVIDSLRYHIRPSSPSYARLVARTTVPGRRRRESFNGVVIEVLGLPHGGRRHRAVEHLGFVIELAGRRVLHVGDTDVSEEVFAPLRLDTARIDVALLPYWALTNPESRRVVERWIRPRQIVAFHVGEDETEKIPAEIRATMPGAVVFTRSLDARRW